MATKTFVAKNGLTANTANVFMSQLATNLTPTAASYNPTTYVIEAMRAIMIDGWVTDLITKGVLFSGGFALLTLTFAVVSAKKATEKA